MLPNAPAHLKHGLKTINAGGSLGRVGIGAASRRAATFLPRGSAQTVLSTVVPTPSSMHVERCRDILLASAAFRATWLCRHGAEAKSTPSHSRVSSELLVSSPFDTQGDRRWACVGGALSVRLCVQGSGTFYGRTAFIFSEVKALTCGALYLQ